MNDQRPALVARRERRRQRTKRALLDAAGALFADRGVAATRLEDITEAADIGKGAFYNYFASKEAVVAELLSEAVGILDERYLSAIDVGAPLEQKVTAIVRQHERFFGEHPEWLRLFHQARGLGSSGAPAQDKLREVFAGYLRRVGRLLPGQAEERPWSEEDRLDLAAALAGAISGYASFRAASGLPSRTGVVEVVMAGGLQHAVARRSSRERDPPQAVPDGLG